MRDSAELDLEKIKEKMVNEGSLWSNEAIIFKSKDKWSLIEEIERLRGDNLSYKVILDGLKKQMKILEGKDEDRSELIAEARKIVDAEHEHMKGTAYYLTPSSQMIEKLIAQAAKLQEINKNLMRNIGRK